MRHDRLNRARAGITHSDAVAIGESADRHDSRLVVIIIIVGLMIGFVVVITARLAI